MPKIDEDLKAALKIARTKRMHFALVIKAPGEGTLIVNKKPVPAGAIAEAKSDIGGGRVVKGRVAGSGTGPFVFETAKEPDEALAKTLRAVIKLDAGLVVKVETRKAPDLVDEDEEQANAKAKADAEAKLRQGLLKRLESLRSDIARMLASTSPDAGKVRGQLAAFKAAMDRKDYAEAAKILDELEKLLGQDPVEQDNRQSPMYCYEMGKADGQERAQSYRVKIRKDDKACLEAYDEGYAEGLKLPAKTKAHREQWSLVEKGVWTGDAKLSTKAGAMVRFRLKNLSDQVAKFWVTPTSGGLPSFKSLEIAPKGQALVNFSVNAPKPVDWDFEISTKHSGTPVMNVQWELFGT